MNGSLSNKVLVPLIVRVHCDTCIAQPGNI
jgi:hypothetical protein